MSRALRCGPAGLPFGPMRRALLLGPALAALGLRAGGAQAAPVVRPGVPIVLPRDFGSHPAYRTEWWYVTGWLEAAASAGGTEAVGSGSTGGSGSGSARTSGFGSAETFGFQLTFFRSRTDVAAGHPSRFAAHQLISAHVALTDLAAGRLRHAQRLARAGFGIAEAAEGDTDLRLRDWRLWREPGPVGAHAYRAMLDAQEAAGFALDLRFAATQPVLRQGDGGYSRKGPEPTQASHYLSEPQLVVDGTLRRDGRPLAVRGRAWLDHEWSEALMHPEAVGWDWIGINLADGSALTAFRLRRADGSALWAGGSFRPAGAAEARAFGPDEVRFTPQRRWRSPATGADYPVVWQVETPAGRHTVRARLDAQELDGRGSTGAIYWEGLSELLDEGGRRIGLGYLEMTGYARALRL